MILKDLFVEEVAIENRKNEIHREIMGKLKPIFNKLRDIYVEHTETDNLPVYMDKEHCFKFNSWCDIDGYKIIEDMLYLHYYDYGYDCYDSDYFVIPLSVVEDELSPLGKGNETVVWYNKQWEEADKRREEKSKEKERAQADEEYKQYLKLKEKYEEQ